MGPSFVRFQNFGRQVPGSAWWMIMAPGLMLIAVAFAILVWPELLAYMVAFIIMSLGITITGWGWRLRRLERSATKRQFDHQHRGQSGNQFQQEQSGVGEPRASETVIYYER